MSTLLCEKPLQIRSFRAIFLPNFSEVTLKGINEEDDMDKDKDDMNEDKDDMDDGRDDMSEDTDGMDEDEGIWT